MRLRVTPGGGLRGAIQVAADKSISHRAVLFGAIARGVTRINNALPAADVLATVRAFRQMGVVIERGADGEFIVHGVGLRGLSPPPNKLDLGNSGTAMRLLAGVLCGQAWDCILDGDASLRRRPMARITEPLTRMGARITARHGYPPLAIRAAALRGIHYDMPVASAQVKSCLLLAGLYADGATAVAEPAITRDHTERMLAGFGGEVQTEGGRIRVRGGELRAQDCQVPADLSSAAFFLVGASICTGSDLALKNVGVNPTRAGVLTILKRMGADIELQNRRLLGGEPVADIRVRAADLRGCRIGGDDIALAIDEIPALAIAAAVACGDTEICDAAELRVKESDRLASIAAGLSALGIAVQPRADGLRIRGGTLRGGRVDSYGDHRIAMAFAMAGTTARAPIEITNCENIATSFPNFCAVAEQAGVNIVRV